MNNNKQLIINMSASLFAYIVMLGINFLLSPYIVKNVGIDAYGFVGLANNFVSYAALATIALNSLAGRFVTVKIYEDNMHEANVYFSSVFISNLLIAVVLGIIGTFAIVFLEKMISIPGSLYWDVKILFSLLFINCLVSTIDSVFAISTFATNKLYINSIRQIEANILKVIILLLLFLFFKPRIAYIGIATLIMGIYILLFDIYYKKKLLPDIHIRLNDFSLSAVIKLISSGVWNLIIRIGQLLLDGLDLLITNIFINATAMGILSLAKLVPAAITGIVGNMVSVFAPNFTILYAQKENDKLIKAIKQSMKIMGIIANVPIIVLIICGRRFYELWQPTQDSSELYLLSILTCMGLIFNGGINCIYDIFTVVNKLKWNAIGVCITGVFSTVAVYVLLKTTNLGLIAVAGISSTLAIIRNLVFTVPYAAYCLKLKWYTFYPEVIKPIMFVSISCFIGLIVEKHLALRNWYGLILMGVISLFVVIIVGGGIILNKDDRKMFLDKIKGRL